MSYNKTHLKPGDLIKSVAGKDIIIIKIEDVDGDSYTGTIKKIISDPDESYTLGESVSECDDEKIFLLNRLIKLKNFNIKAKNKKRTQFTIRKL